MSENICKFVKSKNVMENINIINFVYEKEANFNQSFIVSACHGLYLAITGNGVLHTLIGDYQISAGDLFLTFSSKQFYIENISNLQYIYISFIGLRASGLFERLHVSYYSPVYTGFSFLRERWISDFENSNMFNIDLICEGLLLYTFSFLCECDEEIIKKTDENGILNLKTYVDMHYTEPTLNLKSVSKLYNYSPKYVSYAFVKLVKISFSEYLRNLRINHAQRLLKCGICNIQEVAYSSGFTDAQYFSKVFKKSLNISPTDYLKKCASKMKNNY